MSFETDPDCGDCCDGNCDDFIAAPLDRGDFDNFDGYDADTHFE